MAFSFQHKGLNDKLQEQLFLWEGTLPATPLPPESHDGLGDPVLPQSLGWRRGSSHNGANSGLSWAKAATSARV